VVDGGGVVGGGVVGAAVVVVGAAVVVAATVLGEAAAWAGTMIDRTIGLIHFSGRARVLITPPTSAARKICRRSTFTTIPQPKMLPDAKRTERLQAMFVPIQFTSKSRPNTQCAATRQGNINLQITPPALNGPAFINRCLVPPFPRRARRGPYYRRPGRTFGRNAQSIAVNRAGLPSSAA
jgi:hypothetical protein